MFLFSVRAVPNNLWSENRFEAARSEAPHQRATNALQDVRQNLPRPVHVKSSQENARGREML